MSTNKRKRSSGASSPTNELEGDTARTRKSKKATPTIPVASEEPIPVDAFVSSDALEVQLLSEEGHLSHITDLVRIVLSYLVPCEDPEMCSPHWMCYACSVGLCAPRIRTCGHRIDACTKCVARVHKRCPANTCQRCHRCLMHATATATPCSLCKQGCKGCVLRCLACRQLHCRKCRKRCGKQRCESCGGGSLAKPLGVVSCDNCDAVTCPICESECQDCGTLGCESCVPLCEDCQQVHCEECECLVSSDTGSEY
jgi:hypothetical protein